ncbi:MAG: 23S rRNA (adenine(2030)-N(6))-methyltransferase RlmJ [Alphaproteobacteria bacterium]
MLSYQHGYHAGHFADVHKHTALCLILRRLARVPTPFAFIDTHAGCGRYDLLGRQAAKTNEWRAGIGKLWGTKVVSEGLSAYLAAVRRVNGGGALRTYPGSPLIAAGIARPIDSLRVMELHPAEHAGLKRAMAKTANAVIERREGFEGLVASVPPDAGRGIALVDPSYEIKEDYARVPAVIGRALARWPAGIFMAWYPILPDDRHKVLCAGFENMIRAATSRDGKGARVLAVELEGPPPARGLRGTGLIVVNPPQRFENVLAEAGDEMAALLFPAGQGRHAWRWL